MKYCIVVPDGAADEPVRSLGDKTPLEAARTPNMDRAAREGLLGTTCHVPPRMTPGSSVAMTSLLGYDPVVDFPGRGPLEAADLGISMAPQDWAVRCNLVTVADDTLVDFTAGHISTREAGVLIDALNKALGGRSVSFHVGVSYRHVMIRKGPIALTARTLPPHDVVGLPVKESYPEGENAEVLISLMERSREVLEPHEVNKVRVDLGQNPANMIWLWGQGRKPTLQSFSSRYGLHGAVVTAVNLVRGLARLVGWEAIRVPGATGYVDTDYAAKGRYAIDALMSHDLVLVHVEAPDEASHERDVRAKVRAIEQIDRQIVGPLMAARLPEPLRLLIVPDHVTTVRDGKHSPDAVPFAMWGAGVEASSGVPFTESHARATEVAVEPGWHLMSEFLGRTPAASQEGTLTRG